MCHTNELRSSVGGDIVKSKPGEILVYGFNFANSNKNLTLSSADQTLAYIIYVGKNLTSMKQFS